MATVMNMTSARPATAVAPRRAASKQCSFATGSTRFAPTRLAAVRTQRQARAMATPPRAEMLWSLKLDTEKSDEKAVLPSIMQLNLTEVIDNKRAGPNNTCSITVGAANDGSVDLIIPIETVSGMHAEIEEEGEGDDGRLFVTDLGSTNGTWLNGKVIKGKSEINPGDTLSFGGEPLFQCLRNAHAHA